MARRNSKDAGNLKHSHKISLCQFQSDKSWLNLQLDKNGSVKKPDELENEMKDPPGQLDPNILDRIHGSMIGMALGDALGAHVEFRPHAFLVQHQVTDLKGGGTWGLEKGQFTDDTSMALCLATSLIARRGYVPYDQLVRYKWWFRDGYMSSTGKCFDIGAATKNSILEFERRQNKFAKEREIRPDEIDFLSDPKLLEEFEVDCSDAGAAGNGSLMRLAPVPLFFHKDPRRAVKYSGLSGRITHGDDKAYDACRYYGALIVAAVNGATRDELLDGNFYEKHTEWFKNKPLHSDIINIARGSYKKGGYEAGIRGKGYVVNALEAALWAFWSDERSFEKGVLKAVNLGDDTDTTAAIYGQLAGAYYGYGKLPKEWVEQVYAKKFIACLSKWITYEGMNWKPTDSNILKTPSMFSESKSPRESDSHKIRTPEKNQKSPSQLLINEINAGSGSKLRVEQTTEKLVEPRSRSRTYNDASATLIAGPNDHHQSDRPKSADRLRVYASQNLITCNQVCDWIKTLGKEYRTYVSTFARHNIDGYWLLNQITDENLKAYGITNEDHRRMILKKIDELKRTECQVTTVQDREIKN